MKLTHAISCVCFLLVCIWLGAPPLAAAQQTPPRPDVLLIMPDQMRGDCLSILGHPGVRTPHLDELARQGALFRRAYSTVPSCIPARHALLTGLFPQTSGVVGFAGKPITTPTLPGLLARGGYATVLVGRYMHQVPATEAYGYQRQILGSTHVDNDDYDRFLKNAVPASGGIRKLVQTAGLTYNGWQAAPWPLADELHPTAWIVRQSRQVIAETRVRRTAVSDRLVLRAASAAVPAQEVLRRLPETESARRRPRRLGRLAALPPNPVNGQAHRVRLEGEALRADAGGLFRVDRPPRRADRPAGRRIQGPQRESGAALGDRGHQRSRRTARRSRLLPQVRAL